MAFHNTAAPGFGQTYDPFADLSGHSNMDDALEFDDTYDGLGDQLDETDDAFNDDTFGGGNEGPSVAKVGKDFDFFGQTAKVADAFEEEHLRYNLQQPVTRAAPPQVSHHYQTGYQYQQRPARTGYEKYREPEPELQVDASIWGVAPKKPAISTPTPQNQFTPPAASRKMMSLEEVEAQMRNSSKATPPAQQSYGAYGPPDAQMALQPGQYQQQQPVDPRHQQFDNRQPQGFQHPGQSPSFTHGHPITVLQRPSSKQPLPTGPSVPSPLSQLQGQQPPMLAPTQILQNPNRAQGGQPGNRGQQSFNRQGQDPSQAAHLTEEDKAAFVEAEARRAKRNHKIFVLSKDNGLMTPQDKSFITRIQLQQLVAATGDPNEHGTDAALAEDFYYQVLNSLRAGQRQNPNQPLNNFAQTYLVQTGGRHGGMRRHGRGADNHVQRMEQQVQRAVEAAKNKPKNKQLVIEGSLGKISFSNAKTPKPLLNIKRNDSSSDARPGSAQRSHARISDTKATLKDVENVYLTLMKMDDLSRNMPPPPPPGENPDQGFIDRQADLQALNQKLWSELKVHESIGATSIHPFIAFISYQKGKKAIPRVFRHLTHEQRTTVLTIIVYHLDQLDVVRGAQVQTGEPVTINAAMRENIEMFSMNVMPCLFQLLNETELPIVTGVLGLITQHANIDLVARTRIGVSMFTMILSRAELLKEAGQATEQTWAQWVQQFNQFFNVLEYTLPNIFPGSVTSGEDVYVWQFLAAIGIGASQEEQQRLVTSVRDRVMGTISMAKTLPADMAKQRLDSVNLFMRSIGLDVELLNVD
ncbi:topoisomerase II-associated protein PAT1 [Microdochium bolleyi]|uniref:Topoisomerase II-associated protein PAT1 n=1 Tax=Microdochium bolleyi TaxID=196109 RepID=A0A136JDI0_9PEZI|nr:topoisomerase II-associated protein PAT1 [Microdochium bolleyi]